MVLYHGRVFELLAQHPLQLTVIDASLGRPTCERRKVARRSWPPAISPAQ
jgi:hypothetical protein